MNRKKRSKITKAIEQSWHPYDDPRNWIHNDFTTAPWPKEKIAEFQKRIDSAFGAENAIVLVWSGDRSYGDAYYTDWFPNGSPKGALERKPVLLFGEFKVSESDYLYASVPRWCLMEVHHGSQLTDWEDASWVSDPDMLGGRKRIRPERAPEFYYVHLRNGVLAYHEFDRGCCTRMWRDARKLCYGKYREPNDDDIRMIRDIRIAMDKAGVAQRNDQPRDAKTVLAANLATKHFVQQSEMRKATAAKDFILSNPAALCGDILQRTGSTMSLLEMERIVKEGLEAEEQERFSKL